MNSLLQRAYSNISHQTKIQKFQETFQNWLFNSYTSTYGGSTKKSRVAGNEGRVWGRAGSVLRVTSPFPREACCSPQVKEPEQDHS